MKRFLFTGFIAVLALAGQIVCAQTIWTTNGVLSGKQSVSGSLGMVSAGSIEKGRFPLSLRYHFEIPQVSAVGGFQYNNDAVDLAMSGVYFPLNTAHFRVGAGALYHAGWFLDVEDKYLISFQNDFMIGAYSTINFWLMFLNIDIGFLGQTITIPALPKAYNTIFQPDMFASIHLGGKLLPNLSAELGIASYDLYHYNLFLNPLLSFALRYEFQTRYFKEKPLEGNIFACFSTSVRYSDMFTLSGHIEYVTTTFTVGYSF
jgi:hypothetical protein